jgi:hypothetical protein
MAWKKKNGRSLRKIWMKRWGQKPIMAFAVCLASALQSLAALASLPDISDCQVMDQLQM